MIALLSIIRRRIGNGERPIGWDLYQLAVADRVARTHDGDTEIILSDAAVERGKSLLEDPERLVEEMSRLVGRDVQADFERGRRLHKANMMLRVYCPVLTSPEQYTQRYLACQCCEHAKRDNLGYATGCALCGCGSDPLRRRWMRLDGECADFAAPKWTPGEHLRASSE